ncbi:MAG: VOC family protein [Pseudomonadota bacterium]|nr:VOC family protein [Pseudomonadota bacterium]
MSQQTLHMVTGFALVTADLSRLVRFYRDVLGFAAHGEEKPIDQAEMALLGLSGTGRRQVMSLGKQTISIDQFEQAGRRYPADGDAASLWFQHLALVVSDMGEAFAQLRDVVPISQGGPQQLPNSSGGVQAFKFRDPDGHPLELLQFPDGKTPGVWRDRRRLDGQIGLGIDHSATSVADAEASAAFYQALGLVTGERTLNEGPAQQRLDGLANVEVAVAPMKPASGTPHLELLGYRTPKGQAGPALRANDVAATRIVWRGRETQLIRDPDGHLQQAQT